TNATDVLRPVYDAAKGGDGLVSVEVSPELAHDTEQTCADAIDLHTRIGRPNVMIKIPATLEGLPAITRTIAAGINVNVTLSFSLARAEAAPGAARGPARHPGDDPGGDQCKRPGNLPRRPPRRRHRRVPRRSRAARRE